ncbi:hypothetical protein SLEP1_g9633 [Rubroshorea leprosula]|uniref:Uncharacterized protein n=1 Tax=Rubroshorea leprosula TaxID=152421 RepID=A0AAV5IEW5_9ROSI|nr:hypothetical protein SLEP1_g9633 [Rubroshorea leprosula]
MQNWVLDLFPISAEVIRRVLVLLWALYCKRSDVTFNGVHFTRANVVQLAGIMISNFDEAALKCVLQPPCLMFVLGSLLYMVLSKLMLTVGFRTKTKGVALVV